ncbi:hypothetical protein AHAS_Ahas16G0204200 [Arachis hypogaea]
MIHTAMNSTMIQVVVGRTKIREHLTFHTPLIKSHHHLSIPSMHLCKIVQPHLPVPHLKILNHLTMPQHKVSSKINITHFSNHRIHFTTQKIYFNIHKIHSIPLKTTSPQHIHVHKITLNLHLLS